MEMLLLTPKLLKSTLSQAFYERDTVQVAQELLGKVLLVQVPGTLDQYFGGRIIETEAYCENDAASHAARGKTLRSSVMFEKPGHAYVYFIYGMYDMFNMVTEPEGRAGAVLIRALEPLVGFAEMRRNLTVPERISSATLCSGPGKLCKALGITRKDNREPLIGPRFLVVDDGCQPTQILSSPRVGIKKAQEKLWRFFIAR